MTRWTEAEMFLLRELYPDVPALDVAALLGRRVGQVHQTAARHGIRKSASFFASDLSARIQRGQQNAPMISARFGANHKPWNTGMKGWSAPGTEATRFKPGSTPPNRQQVGALRINSDGQLDIKLYDGLRSWVQLHHYVWFLEHGEWPPRGFVLRFRDGDVHNPAIENLQLITRRENMRLNSVHTIYPPELARLIQLRGALKRQINHRQKSLTSPKETQ